MVSPCAAWEPLEWALFLVNKPQGLRPFILYITPATPFSPKSGAEQRSALMYEALSLIGIVDILVLVDGEYSHPRYTVLPNHAVLIESQKKGAWGLSRYHADARFTDTIARLLPRPMNEYQLIIGRYLWPISQLAIPENVPRIVDLDDFNYRYSPEVSFSLSLVAERIKKGFSHWLANHQLAKYSGAFVVNAQDSCDITQLPTRFLPNIAYGSSPKAPSPPELCGKNLLFVGSLWYRPNAEGVSWFLTHVWPVVKRTIPEAKLTLVGAASSAVRSRWEKYPDVIAPGFVDDLHDVYQQASLVIVPIHMGGGSNIKVLEALAHARPCVVTRLTAAAFRNQLHHGQHFLVADNAPQFAQCVLQVLQQPEAYQAMATMGYEVVQTEFSAKNFTAQVGSFVREVLS